MRKSLLACFIHNDERTLQIIGVPHKRKLSLPSVPLTNPRSQRTRHAIMKGRQIERLRVVYPLHPNEYRGRVGRVERRRDQGIRGESRVIEVHTVGRVRLE